MATPHNEALRGDIADIVLLPGDPLRAKYIADEYLTDTVQFNGVRNMLGFTGLYKDKKISVMGSGMGMPSIGIYSYELFKEYDVNKIIRIGSAGAIDKNLQLKDIVFAQGASTDSNWEKQYNLGGSFAPIADYKLLSCAVSKADKLGVRYKVGNVLSSDIFYTDDPDYNLRWAKMGVLAVEMEAAALYMNAARSGKEALAMFTISDHLVSGQGLSAEERQVGFRQMMEIALETACDLGGRDEL